MKKVYVINCLILMVFIALSGCITINTQPTTPVPTPTARPSVPQSSSGGDFTIISDGRYGISYVLPLDWHIVSENELRQVPNVLPSAYLGEVGDEYAMIYVRAVLSMAGLSLYEIQLKRLQQMGNIDSSESNPFRSRAIVVGGHPGFRLDYSYFLEDTAARAIEIWVIKGDLVFQLFMYAYSEKYPQLQATFDHVISSLDFE
jgi:hypothetical protein